MEVKALSLATTKLPALKDPSYHTSEMILDVYITSEEIIYAIQRLKLGKAVGDDGLSPEHLHYGGDSSGLDEKSFQFNPCL